MHPGRASHVSHHSTIWMFLVEYVARGDNEDDNNRTPCSRQRCRARVAKLRATARYWKLGPYRSARRRYVSLLPLSFTYAETPTLRYLTRALGDCAYHPHTRLRMHSLVANDDVSLITREYDCSSRWWCGLRSFAIIYYIFISLSTSKDVALSIWLSRRP